MTKEDCFIGVDVGSGSVRAALVTGFGKVLRVSVKPIKIWKPSVDYFEQSSDDIWNGCISVIKDVIAGHTSEHIKGIGFDATCSLVVLDENGLPLTVSTTGDNQQNVVVWMDHRAKQEAQFINETNHKVLQYVGGKVSLEMQMPKLLWLKKQLPATWKSAGMFFDLPDYLTWKATGSETRSLCSLVCKWNYECSAGGTHGWNSNFLTQIGLNDLLDNKCKKIGKDVLAPGSPCGKGLSKEIAHMLNLKPGTPVGTSIIDAHAGGLGLIGTQAENISMDMMSRLSLICGTSTCHMAVNPLPVNVPGIWGPYFSAMVPGLWLNEAGQSASGLLVDFIVMNHTASAAIAVQMKDGMIVQDYLRILLQEIAERNSVSNVNFLTKDFHIWPDFHGNRSPLSDPNMTGMISGLTLSSNEENLAILYLATIQALAYGTRHIMETLNVSGYETFKSLLICGGLSSDPLYVQIQADAVGLPILKPREKEAVLIGAAILGACGANYFQDINEATLNMCGQASVITPDESVKSYHDKKYKVFLKMLQDQLEYRDIMN